MILNGSPLKNSNTDQMLQACVNGAESAGSKVTVFRISDMNVHPCIACFKGNSSLAQPCTIHDDMDKIYAAVKEAPVLIFATPVYYWAVSAQLKLAIDRLFALEEGEQNLLVHNDRYGGLLCSAAGATGQCGPITSWFDHYILRMHWKSVGYVTAEGNDTPSNMGGAGILEQANALGERAAHGII